VCACEGGCRDRPCALVADARISITGEGANTRTTTKGPIGQLFDTLIWAIWPF